MAKPRSKRAPRRTDRSQRHRTFTPTLTGRAVAVYKHLRTTALKLPGVETSTWRGTPALKVHGRVMGYLSKKSEGALTLRCDILDRQILLQAHPEAFFITEECAERPVVLIRLDKVHRGILLDLIERAWRLLAPRELIDKFDRSRKNVRRRTIPELAMRSGWMVGPGDLLAELDALEE